MRLTDVAQMSLPQGALASYELRFADDPGPRLPVSFDQRRHVERGQRPGSWMAISFRLPAAADRDALATAWHDVVGRHGTLTTAFARDADALVLTRTRVAGGAWAEHPHDPDQSIRDALRAVLDRACAPFERPSHRLCLVEPAAHESDPRPVIIVGSDHAHVDIWSLMVIARDLLAALPGGDASARPASVASFADHTAELERMPREPDRVRERWARILEADGGVMPLFPLGLGDLSRPRPAVVEVRDVVDADGLERLSAEADRAGVRLTPYVLAAITEMTLQCSGRPLRAVFPVHSRHDGRWHDAVGWFITNSVIECADADPRACADSLRQALALGSHPLAPILAPYGGMPEAPGMFAISWLDLRRLPVRIPAGLDAQWVSAVTATDGVMVWFVVDETGLHLRCRYPDTAEARDAVGTWLDAAIAALRGAG